MAFRFERKDRSVEDGVQRIATELLDVALGGFVPPEPKRGGAHREPPPAPAVHELRKTTKKLRGLLQLVRPRFADFHAENAALRDAAAQMAALRDAEVRLATFTRLTAPLAGKTDLAPLVALIEAEIATLRAPGAMAGAVAALQDGLAAQRGRVGDWRIRGKEFAAFEDGLERSWRRARRQMEAARGVLVPSGGDAFDATPFHEWRKAVKHHWYQARLLQPVWPAMMNPHVAAANELGEILGEHNDIDVLTGFLDARASALPADSLRRVGKVALARRRALARRAVRAGERLFAGGAGALVERWGIWWRIWRD